MIKEETIVHYLSIIINIITLGFAFYGFGTFITNITKSIWGEKRPKNNSFKTGSNTPAFFHKWF